MRKTQTTMGLHESTFVARGANSNTQLDPSCVSVPLAINVDLFVCFTERLFKSSSISYLSCRRVASDSLYVGMPYVWSIDRTAKTTPSWHSIQSNDPRRFIDCKCTLMYTLYFNIDGHVIQYQYLTMYSIYGAYASCS